MKIAVLTLLGLVSIAACKTSNSALSSRPPDRDEWQNNWSDEQLPSFPLEEWKKHLTGPTLEPYFLQNEIYEVNIAAKALPRSREKTEAQMTISNSSGTLLSNNKISIKLRGFTSLDFAKKQYGISPLDADGKDQSVSFLEMPKAEDWVLSAPYNDKSLLRDIVTYNLSNLIGRHAPRTRIVRLSFAINGRPAQSKGIYVLTEKNTFGKGRIEIPKKNESGTSFQATFDHQHDGDNVVWSGRETDVILEYPSIEKIKPEEQQEFLDKFMAVEDLVSEAQGNAWDSIFEDKLDLSSAVDFFVIQELTRNIDGFRLSSGFYIPPKGKIFFGPLWDFNIAYGNAEHENGVQYEGWRSEEKGVWFGTLLTHPKFCAAVKKRWTEARAEGQLSNNTIFNVIDREAAVMKPIADENFEIWPSLGSYLWPNPYWLKTWDGEKDALKSWISLRTQWMDKAVEDLNCSNS